MKNLRTVAGLFFIMMLFSFAALSQTSQNGTTDQTKTSCCPNGKNFVDNNKDGVCDNYQNNVKGCTFVDKNNDGKCDNCKNAKTGCNCCKDKGKKSSVKTNGKGKGCGKSCGNCPKR